MKLKITNPEILEKFIDNLLNELADEIFFKSQENLTKPFKDPEGESKYSITDTGTLLKSGFIQKQPLNKTINYKAPYSSYIEFGTLPHSVSKEGQKAIKKWVQRKLGLSEKKARSVAYAIIQKIKTHGQDPKPFLRNAISYVRNKYQK